MDKIKEIKQKVETNKTKTDKLLYEIQKLHKNIDTLVSANNKLNQELKKLEAIEEESISADWFLDSHKDMEYMGKANGKNKTCEGNIYANCNICKIPLELFEGNTGIGGYVIGTCPNCKIEIDFTNTNNW